MLFRRVWRCNGFFGKIPLKLESNTENRIGFAKNERKKRPPPPHESLNGLYEPCPAIFNFYAL